MQKKVNCFMGIYQTYTYLFFIGTRGFERSISGGNSWYAERSSSNGPASAGIIGPGASEESTNNGSMSPR